MIYYLVDHNTATCYAHDQMELITLESETYKLQLSYINRFMYLSMNAFIAKY